MYRYNILDTGTGNNNFKKQFIHWLVFFPCKISCALHYLTSLGGAFAHSCTVNIEQTHYIDKFTRLWIELGIRNK